MRARAAANGAWSIGRVPAGSTPRRSSSARAIASASQSSQSSAPEYAGSTSVTPGSSSPIEGVIVDWWAPPSGASVTPDGVPAMTNAGSE